jgi:transposase
VPGRKTDVKDAEWIAQLMRLGLLKRSFIPDVEQRDLRDLTRYRTRLLAERTAASNRLQKIMEDANIKLSAVASHIQGVSARAMLEALIRARPIRRVSRTGQGALRAKIPELEQALVGAFASTIASCGASCLYHLDELNNASAALECPDPPTHRALRASSSVWMPFQASSLHGRGDPGRDRPDVTPFPDCQASGRLGLSLSRQQHQRREAPERQDPAGQNWLRTALVEAAWAVAGPRIPISARNSIACEPAAATSVLPSPWPIPS